MPTSACISASQGGRHRTQHGVLPAAFNVGGDLALMQQIDRLHTEFPFAGSRMLRRLLAINGSKVGRRHVKTLMRLYWPVTFHDFEGTVIGGGQHSRGITGDDRVNDRRR